MFKKSVLFVILMVVLGVNWVLAECPEQITGAIWTTTAGCGKVDGNIYTDKNHVYLSGGPHRPSGPGLPLSDDSIYVFQVTDPSGKVLLSCDPIQCRRVKINSNGVISAVVSGSATPNSFICLKPGGNPNTPNPCQHFFVNCDAASGRISVRLMPYADTPNNGGEYKAWMTPLCRYNPSDPHSYFGFIERYSKTDNFKVRQRARQITLFGRKFFDRNGNGIQDDPICEPGLPGWPITLSGISSGTILPQTTTTGTFGDYGFLVTAGTYAVTESEPPNNVNWSHTTPASIVSIVVLSSDVTKGPFNFGNVYKICGTKFFDTDGDGIQDLDEKGIANWKISLSGTDPCSAPQNTLTDNSGNYCFVVFTGSYNLEEGTAPSNNWRNTTPTTLGTGAVVVDYSNSTVAGPFKFGNRVLPCFCTPRWDCHGPGCASEIRDTYFPTVFPNGLILGDPDGPYDWDLRYALLLTSGLMVEMLLPQSGISGPLLGDETNPLTSGAGSLAGELGSATMNVKFDRAGILPQNGIDCGFALKDLVYVNCVADTIKGKTVAAVLDAANRILSGEFGFFMGPDAPISVPGFGTITINQLTMALTTLNVEFANCDTGVGCLAIPGSLASQTTILQPGELGKKLSSVLGNSPNPFNTTTEISYSISVDEHVYLVIYNIMGQKVKILVNEKMTAGLHRIIWDGRNDVGEVVASGIYFYSIKAGTYAETKKMTLLK